MSISLKKTLTAGLTLVLLASTGASLNNVNVNAKHVRTHRIYHHHSKKSHKVHAKKMHKSKKINHKRHHNKHVTKNKYYKDIKQLKAINKHYCKKYKTNSKPFILGTTRHGHYHPYKTGFYYNGKGLAWVNYANTKYAIKEWGPILK